MFKMILVGGLALSVFCFFMAQNASHRNQVKNGYPDLSSKYGPPSNSEFYDYPSPNDTSTSTEPYFRIVLSKKSNTSIPTKNIPSTSTTEASEYFNDVYSDDYKEDEFRQNFTLMYPFLNDTLSELERYLNPNISRNSSKISLKTTSSTISENIATPIPTASSVHHNTTDIHWSRLIPENVTSTTILPTQSPSATGIVTKVLFQTTTVNYSKTNTTPNPRTKVSPVTRIPSTLSEIERRDHNFETVTESQIDSESLIPVPRPSTKFLNENAIFLSKVGSPHEISLTESSTLSTSTPPGTTENLSYLPKLLPPSASLSAPEPTPRTVEMTNSNTILSQNMQNIISQPSRLYLPPKQN